jgi:cell wall-associated NlpC family hydrolase
MIRNPVITVALVCMSLMGVPLHEIRAETTKSSKTTKKKSPVSAAKKKTTAAPDAADAPASKKGSGSSPLDLPFPAKVGPSGEVKPIADKQEPAIRASGNSTSEKPDTEPAAKREHAPSATVEPEAIAEFAEQPPRIQQLIRDAIDLTRRNLTYTFGSADPDKGGMDCSGTIYYLLRAHGFDDVARDSSGQYLWARKSGACFPVVSKNPESVEFKEMLPGDLMFWTGTYQTSRDVPISHVMLYLGREKVGGKRIMFGASDGRSYNGVPRWGVSVFDFKMPKPDGENVEQAKVDFVGYARIPGLRNPAPSEAAEQTPPPSKAAPQKSRKTAPPATPRSKPSSSKKKKAK